MNGEPNPAATYAEALNTGAAATISHAVKPTQSMTVSYETQRVYGLPATPTHTQLVIIDDAVVYNESYPDHTPHTALIK